MIRGPNSKKNEVLHDHMHLESENQLSAPVVRAAILFNAKNRHFPRISQRVIPAHFFRYGLKYSNQVRNLGGHNLVTGFKQFYASSSKMSEIGRFTSDSIPLTSNYPCGLKHDDRTLLLVLNGR